jgi:hypothetical protein
MPVQGTLLGSDFSENYWEQINMNKLIFIIDRPLPQPEVS